MNIQLQTILMPDSEICTEEGLFFHEQNQKICFDGYFNLFYIEKWKRYTNLESLQLKITLKGYRRIFLYHNRECIREKLLFAEKEDTYILTFPWEQFSEGVFYFAIEREENSDDYIQYGFYIGNSEKVRDVGIGVDICTFQREKYILKNLETICRCILDRLELQVSTALWVYIVDNGRTLDEYVQIQSYIEKYQKKIMIFPNKNAGGAGGFTRGMLEILKDKQERHLTHVVLMDDDAMMHPDLFIRIYGFLQIVKEEWEKITLGGTMLFEDEPYRMYASGERWMGITIENPNFGLDLRKYKNASHKKLLTTQQEKEYYSAWWCCCYSLQVVREDNLPIPLFLHHDDIEFGMRNLQYGVVFLNGVSVWHKNFVIVPEQNIYYDIRNGLIEITLRYGEAKAGRFAIEFLLRRLVGRIRRDCRNEAFLIIKGAEDFLKGPKWLWEQDPQHLHQSIKNIPCTTKRYIWFKSIKICLKFLANEKRAIRDYQQNLHKYTTKQAWLKYLDIFEKVMYYEKHEK